ncbi:MAG: hypothetical protein M1834_003791 [Cirrosporium novae-zelandiae]|nr:MAG: hypothetical protein M1834_003791 [Cirrosporium novae-zelandiae]
MTRRASQGRMSQHQQTSRPERTQRSGRQPVINGSTGRRRANPVDTTGFQPGQADPDHSGLTRIGIPPDNQHTSASVSAGASIPILDDDPFASVLELTQDDLDAITRRQILDEYMANLFRVMRIRNIGPVVLPFLPHMTDADFIEIESWIYSLMNDRLAHVNMSFERRTIWLSVFGSIIMTRRYVLRGGRLLLDGVV